MRREPILRVLSVGQLRGIAEELPARIDRAIAVAIEDQKAVIRRHPASRSLDAIGIMIEQNRVVLVDARALYAVAVEIERERIAALKPSRSQLEKISDRADDPLSELLP